MKNLPATALAVVVAIACALALVQVYSRTTTDFEEALARMNPEERHYFDEVLVQIRPNSTPKELRRLLGPPRLETPLGTEWEAPVWPGRIRVYRTADGRRVSAIAWRKIGWFDLRYKPWELRRRG